MKFCDFPNFNFQFSNFAFSHSNVPLNLNIFNIHSFDFKKIETITLLFVSAPSKRLALICRCVSSTSDSQHHYRALFCCVEDTDKQKRFNRIHLVFK